MMGRSAYINATDSQNDSLSFQSTRTASIRRSMSVLGSCCESWRPLSANTRASTRWTFSVQPEPSSPRSKVSYDDQPSLTCTHTHSYSANHTTYSSSSSGLFSVSTYQIPPFPLTVSSPGFSLSPCPFLTHFFPCLKKANIERTSKGMSPRVFF